MVTTSTINPPSIDVIRARQLKAYGLILYKFSHLFIDPHTRMRFRNWITSDNCPFSLYQNECVIDALVSRNLHTAENIQRLGWSFMAGCDNVY